MGEVGGGRPFEGGPRSASYPSPHSGIFKLLLEFVLGSVIV